jgi:pimeloyl-ACP methyl ester carboxylesterase
VRRKLVLVSLVLAAVVLSATARAAVPKRVPEHNANHEVKIWTVRYRAHTGAARKAYVVLPAWYGPRNNPEIPFVISPHGRGVSARTNARLWGNLPWRGSFGVISPEGGGRKLGSYSWGSYAQIEDLARMPRVARSTLPWLEIASGKVYAIGGSMGGQETLLLVARHPELLAGAAAFDSVTNFALQYRMFPKIPCNKRCRIDNGGSYGKQLQRLAREEIGGTPATRPTAYAIRSPMTYARAIAWSCVPLQLWWSVSDRIVVNQRAQSGALFDKVKRLNPHAPVQAYVGYWTHSVEMQAQTRLPVALAELGLLGAQSWKLTRGLHFVPPPKSARCR